MFAKRVLAAILWFFAGWYAGAFVAFMLDLSPALGPILGTAGAALFAGDPRGIIWTARTKATVKRVEEIAAQRQYEQLWPDRTAA